ncbi:MAG: SPFH domain-containing protein [Lachnospiraceae bacterium]|jgi:regulator of protease activity HflC (stomatin/prohibitin superfamily)|nr:SPFH domain-containing protein [Lachnospiraceae bacterium]
MEETKKKEIEERVITKNSGFKMLFLIIAGYISAILCFICCYYLSTDITSDNTILCGILMILGIILVVLFTFLQRGFHILTPNEAIVLTLFGEYYGTIKKEGFYYTNPFASCMAPGKEKNTATQKKISLKTLTLNNKQQKVNDQLGNPIIIGAIAVWKVVNPTKAILNVENYQTYLSIQCDSVIRNISRLYPYDLLQEEEENSHEKTLRGSSQEIADSMKQALEERVKEAGIAIEEVRITHLSYAEEIAAAMLQRQQAEAIISARKKIVEGAVGMVEMALEKLDEQQVIALDDERKAAMVSNLLVVLCGHQEAQPIINSGSIY